MKKLFTTICLTLPFLCQGSTIHHQLLTAETHIYNASQIIVAVNEQALQGNDCKAALHISIEALECAIAELKAIIE